MGITQVSLILLDFAPSNHVVPFFAFSKFSRIQALCPGTRNTCSYISPIQLPTDAPQFPPLGLFLPSFRLSLPSLYPFTHQRTQVPMTQRDPRFKRETIEFAFCNLSKTSPHPSLLGWLGVGGVRETTPRNGNRTLYSRGPALQNPKGETSQGEEK